MDGVPPTSVSPTPSRSARTNTTALSCLQHLGAALFTCAATATSIGAQIELVSQNSNGVPADGTSYDAAISADGRTVAFVSGADNLAPGDFRRGFNVFVRDRLLGTTELAAVTWNGADVNDSSSEPSLSADGRRVAFLSTATNLVPDDANGAPDLYVRDRLLGTTIVASLTSGGTLSQMGVQRGSISADGTWVVFESDGSDFVDQDTNGVSDVFVRNLVSGVVERVSVRDDGTQALLPSYYGSLSFDGSRVAFASFEALLPDDLDDFADVYVLDRAASELLLASPTYDGSLSDNESTSPAISLDGMTVAFAANDSRLVPGDTNHAVDVFWHDLVSNTTGRANVSTEGEVLSGSAYLAISGDGRAIGFLWQRVFVHDRATGETTLMDAAPDGDPGNSDCSPYFRLSFDGRWVAWASFSSNLGTNDGPALSDAFVRERDTLRLGFETEDDFSTPLVNGQHIDTEFGRLVSIASSGTNAGLAIFDSTVGGPNDPSQDEDLLVDTGNVLILQTENISPDANDVFPRPNDDEDGGTISFLLSPPLEAVSLRLIDFDAGDGPATLVLTDTSSRRRIYTVPGGWTGDRLLSQPGQGTLNLTTLGLQSGLASTAEASQDPFFDATRVTRIDVNVDGSGAVDDLCLSTANLPRASAVRRNGSGSNEAILTSASRPVIGTCWRASLDCGFADGTATLFIRSQPSAGPRTPYGEILIGGTLLTRVSCAFSGTAAAFSRNIPNDLALCGVTIHSQALCSGASYAVGHKLLGLSGRWSNAVELLLGL